VFGGVDVVVPIPGPTSIDLSTSGVPAGTTLEVKVKPRVGGAPSTSTVTLSACDANGACPPASRSISRLDRISSKGGRRFRHHSSSAARAS